MSGIGYGTGRDYRTVIVVVIGILIFAGIASVAGPIIENIGATDTNNPIKTRTDGDGGVGINSAVDDNEWDNVEYYSNEYHLISNAPKVIKIWDDGSKGYANMYITNLREEGGGIVKFCVENHNNIGDGRSRIGTIKVYTETWGGTTFDRFEDVAISPGSQKCFETRNINCGNLRMSPDEQVKFKIS